MGVIRPVWNSNFLQEVDALRLNLNRYKLLSMDTEFPGFLRETPRHAPDSVVYDDLKFTVDSTNLIQLGVTLLDDHGNIGPTWEFNFMFDLEKENHVHSSIQFLKKSGLDFDKIKQDGVPRNLFLLNFLNMVSMHHDLKWVTFHGIYDLAHVLKLFTGNPLPNTAEEFGRVASSYFHCVLDLKLAAKHCDGLKKVEVGLTRLSKILNVNRLGEAHNAGSDSLLTAHVYAKLMENYNIRVGNLDGILYGLENVRIGGKNHPSTRTYKSLFLVPHPHGPHPMPVQYGPCAAYAMSFKPRIPVPMHPRNYGGQPSCYYVHMHPPPMVMPVPHITMM